MHHGGKRKSAFRSETEKKCLDQFQRGTLCAGFASVGTPRIDVCSWLLQPALDASWLRFAIRGIEEIASRRLRFTDDRREVQQKLAFDLRDVAMQSLAKFARRDVRLNVSKIGIQFGSGF